MMMPLPMVALEVTVVTVAMRRVHPMAASSCLPVEEVEEEEEVEDTIAPSTSTVAVVIISHALLAVVVHVIITPDVTIDVINIATMV